MRINVTETIKDFDGQPILENDKPIEFRQVFATALNALVGDEQPLAEEKAKRFAVGVKLYQGKEINITVDEAAVIKERVGKVYNPIFYGRTCELLDGAATETPPPTPPATN